MDTYGKFGIDPAEEELARKRQARADKQGEGVPIDS